MESEMFEQKYDMTKEENVFLAKRNIVDSIWKAANLEGIAVTYPETNEIFEGRTVAGFTLNETKAINNLKHAWQFILENTDLNIDIQLLRHLNGLIGAEGVVLGAGIIREFDVIIGGTEGRPDIPDYDGMVKRLREISEIESATERGLGLFCEICRGQWFSDGNKRTAQLAANMVLIDNGCGILVVPQKYDRAFRDELLKYYESGIKESLMRLLYDVALDGADFTRQRAHGVEPAFKATEKGQSLDERSVRASKDSARQRFSAGDTGRNNSARF
jgi:hypothetical protein